jgi:RHS repeat-associated protein
MLSTLAQAHRPLPPSRRPGQRLPSSAANRVRRPPLGCPKHASGLYRSRQPFSAPWRGAKACAGVGCFAGRVTTPPRDPGVDPNTGLVYLRARWYDPATGQFLSVDPLESETQQAYVYADDDPVTLADLSGLTPWSPKVRAAAAKCADWKREAHSEYYTNHSVYSACQVLLHLPSQVYGTGGGSSGGSSDDDFVAVACGLGGPSVALATRGVAEGSVAEVSATFCAGYAAGTLIVLPVLHDVFPSVFP